MSTDEGEAREVSPSLMSAEFKALCDELTAHGRDVERVRKALSSLGDERTLRSPQASEAALSGVDETLLARFGMAERASAHLVSLRAHIQQTRVGRRRQLMGALRQATEREGLEVRVLTQQPLVVLLAPMTVEVDFDKDRARITFAREVVDEVGLDALEIVAARERAMATIKHAALPSDAFFDLLHAAYRTVCAARGAMPGERVDLVDLLAPLALLRAGLGRWRSLNFKRLEAFPRYLLAYQLHRLRRDGLLSKDGRRMELGTATAGSARSKKNVIFLPTTPAEGQYYLSIRVSGR